MHAKKSFDSNSSVLLSFHITEPRSRGGPNEREYHVVSKEHYQVEYNQQQPEWANYRNKRA